MPGEFDPCREVTTTTSAKSYAETRLGLRSRAHEFADLYRSKVGDIPAQVAGVIHEIEETQLRVVAVGGPELRGLRVLDIGPGQRLGHFLAIAAANQSTGIDIDLNPSGFDIPAYWRLWRTNGSIRFLKTVGRRGLLIDFRYRRELVRQLGIDRIPPYELRCMDATKMTFDEDSFDFVYSRSAFEHISDPCPALIGITSVLAPGGYAHISVHLYTSDGGCHDVRILSGNRGSLPFWPHLRPETSDLVRPNCYLNRIRLGEWEELFQETMPGVQFFRTKTADPAMLAELGRLRRGGQLKEYSEDELLTVALHAVWRKPS